ncbi:11000_t:CDS:2 [Funneliformis geosporum]|uniref:11000_t:CDS:1 n=1 Tax=Funneliformis geosporum TaxID=1117311 RepID=A0A9W4SLV5_9GLOM|nr:11000_t:CDS:2 [Funneliformis geosporum]
MRFIADLDYFESKTVGHRHLDMFQNASCHNLHIGHCPMYITG